MASIIPGIDWRALERTDGNRGEGRNTELLSELLLYLGKSLIDFLSNGRRKLVLVVAIVVADFGS